MYEVSTRAGETDGEQDSFTESQDEGAGGFVGSRATAT